MVGSRFSAKYTSLTWLTRLLTETAAVEYHLNKVDWIDWVDRTVLTFNGYEDAGKMYLPDYFSFNTSNA